MLSSAVVNLVDRIGGRHRSTPRQLAKWRGIRIYLNDQLRDVGQVGEVVSIVTFGQNKKEICCYGYLIKGERLFAMLRPAIGETAITYPHFHRLTNWQTGYFVRLSEFEPGHEDLWVALVNIEIASLDLELAIPYPRRPMF